MEMENIYNTEWSKLNSLLSHHSSITPLFSIAPFSGTGSPALSRSLIARENLTYSHRCLAFYFFPVDDQI